MSCSLCGHEKEGSHHLGCLRVVHPDVPDQILVEMGLLAAPKAPPQAEPDKTEILPENSITTVPAEVGACEFDGCDNPKYSDHFRVKYCEGHRDPKNRKE